MKPIGGAASATSADQDTNRLIGDYYQEYKCGSRGYPEGGRAKAVQVNEQEGILGENHEHPSQQQKQHRH